MKATEPARAAAPSTDLAPSPLHPGAVQRRLAATGDGGALQWLQSRVQGAPPVQRELAETGYESLVAAAAAGPVQRAPAGGMEEDPERIHAAARAGTSGPGGPLPHLDTIARSFGNHDVSSIVAHTDAAASSGSRAMSASAFTTGNHVAFSGTPTLHTAAHEAAHVIQQRAGVSLPGGVGSVGDAHEQHADAVADRVVAGRSAGDLLDRYKGSGSEEPIQMKCSCGENPGGTCAACAGDATKAGAPG